jgi:beta-lactamase superfamily II metal-dependent hydrolase
LGELLTRANVPIQTARADQSADLGDGVRLEVLAPAPPFLSDTPRPANNSLVVRVTYGDTAFLFAGGLEQAGETALLARAAASRGDPDQALRSDWLRVARMGTRGATSAEFLRRVRPDMAVISVGARSEAGYPHRETLQRLQATGARVWRTDEAPRAGDLLFRSDGSQVIADEGSTR